MKYYVYVIRSKEAFQYTGMTEDLENRLAKHNNHELSFWTKRGHDWQIDYFEEFQIRNMISFIKLKGLPKQPF